MTTMDRLISTAKFDGNDFSVWKAQMEAYLFAKDVAYVLTKSKPRRLGPESKASDAEKLAKEQEIIEFERIDKQVRSYLLLSLDNKHVKLVLKCESSREIWERLTSVHEQKSSACRILMQKEFFELQMNADEHVQDYMTVCV